MLAKAVFLLGICLLPALANAGDISRGRAYIADLAERHGVAWVVAKSRYFRFLPPGTQADILAAVRDGPGARELLARAQAEGVDAAALPEQSRWLLAEAQAAAKRQ